MNVAPKRMFRTTPNRVPLAVLGFAVASVATSQPADSNPPAAASNQTIDALINASEEHARLFDLAEGIISAALNGGQACAPDRPQVRLRQAALSRALADATPATGPLVLLFAVTANSLADARRLLEAGASREDPWGTALHTAAQFADPPMLEYLVAQGFGLDDVGNAAAPALFVAATSNRKDNVEWLVEHGANVNATDRQGGQLLTHALVCRDQTLIDYLVAAGAQPDAKTRGVAARLGLSVGE